MKRFFLMAVSLVALMGCGAKEKIEKALDIDADLLGQFRTKCTEVTVFDGLPNAIRKVNFTPTGGFKMTDYYYLDDACKDPVLLTEREGDYKAEGELKENKNIKKINFTTDHVYLTVKSQAAIDILSNSPFDICGIKDWDNRLNKKIELTDKKCLGKKMPRKGDVNFDVYRVEDEGKKLYMGKAITFELRDDSDDRPRKVDRELVFTKDK